VLPCVPGAGTLPGQGPISLPPHPAAHVSSLGAVPLARPERPNDVDSIALQAFVQGMLPHRILQKPVAPACSLPRSASLEGQVERKLLSDQIVPGQGIVAANEDLLLAMQGPCCADAVTSSGQGILSQGMVTPPDALGLVQQGALPGQGALQGALHPLPIAAPSLQ